MSYIFNQTGLNAGCGAISACTSFTVSTGPLAKKATDGGAVGSEVTLSLFASNGEFEFVSIVFEIIPGSSFTVWNAGTYTVNINITGENTGNYLESVYICRVDSGCSSLSAIGSSTGNAIECSLGVKTISLSGSEIANPSSTDKIYIIVTTSGSGGNLKITPNQQIITPLSMSSYSSKSSSSKSSS